MINFCGSDDLFSSVCEKELVPQNFFSLYLGTFITGITSRDLGRDTARGAELSRSGAAEQMDLAEQRARLLAQARASLADQKEISAKAQRETALLNQQVAALRDQLGQLQALLDDAQTRDSAAKVQIQSLGSDLNAALARAA